MVRCPYTFGHILYFIKFITDLFEDIKDSMEQKWGHCTSVVIPHFMIICTLVLCWLLVLASSAILSCWWRSFSPCTGLDMPLFMYRQISHMFSCSQSRQCFGWCAWSWNLGGHICHSPHLVLFGRATWCVVWNTFLDSSHLLKCPHLLH